MRAGRYGGLPPRAPRRRADGQLNPLIRKGILEALILLDAANSDDPALQRGATQALVFEQPPDYWEPPEAPDLIDTLRQLGSRE